MSSGKKKSQIVSYIVTTAFAAVITVLVILYELSGKETSAIHTVSSFCDGFFVAGVMILCFGALMAIASAGGFRSIQYLGSMILVLFSPNKSRFEGRRSYYDFLREKEKKEKSSNRHFFVIGGIWMAVAIVFLLIFQQMYQ